MRHLAFLTNVKDSHCRILSQHFVQVLLYDFTNPSLFGLKDRIIQTRNAGGDGHISLNRESDGHRLECTEAVSRRHLQIERRGNGTRM